MALQREEKEKIIEDFKEKIAKFKGMIFFDHSFFKAQDLLKLRLELQEKNCSLKVAKKSLFLIALKENLPQIFNSFQSKVKGALSVIFSQDLIEPSKILFEFQKQYPQLSIWGGYFEGEFLDEKKIEFLAKLPSRKELKTNLIFLFSLLFFNFENLAKKNFSRFLILLNQILKEKEKVKKN